MRVLIVEDEILVALDMEYVLQEGGYEVVGVVADQNAAALVSEPPALAFVDLNLRDGPTGQDIARYFSENHGTVIVYVTANPEQIQHPVATAIGYIQKPYSRDAILTAAAIVAGRNDLPVTPQHRMREFIIYNGMNPAQTADAPQ